MKYSGIGGQAVIEGIMMQNGVNPMERSRLKKILTEA